MYNPYSLEGKTILITGAASGIGKATAIESSKLGAKIVAVDMNVDGLEKVMTQLEGEGHLSYTGNLCHEDFLKELGENTPVLDGVFLCAGVSDTTPVKFITEDNDVKPTSFEEENQQGWLPCVDEFIRCREGGTWSGYLCSIKVCGQWYYACLCKGTGIPQDSF